MSRSRNDFAAGVIRGLTPRAARTLTLRAARPLSADVDEGERLGAVALALEHAPAVGLAGERDVPLDRLVAGLVRVEPAVEDPDVVRDAVAVEVEDREV